MVDMVKRAPIGWVDEHGEMHVIYVPVEYLPVIDRGVVTR